MCWSEEQRATSISPLPSAFLTSLAFNHPVPCLRAAYGDAGRPQTGRATYCCHDSDSAQRSSGNTNTATRSRVSVKKQNKTQELEFFFSFSVFKSQNSSAALCGAATALVGAHLPEGGTIHFI